MKKVIFILYIILCIIKLDANAQVMKEENPYDFSLNAYFKKNNISVPTDPDIREEQNARDWSNLFRPVSYEETLANTPTFVGNDPRLEGYGESRYDKGLTYSGLETKTVAENRREHQLDAIDKTVTVIVITVVLILVILVIMNIAVRKQS